MNPDHLRRNNELLDKLASEYVLGTLQGAARRRFEQWMRQDAFIGQAVTRWQTRLNPLAELVPPVPPGPHVWAAVERQLNLSPASRKNGLRQLGENLQFWRRLSFASTAVAAVLLAVLLVREPDTASGFPSHVATLADEKNQTVLLATNDPGGRRMTVHIVRLPAMESDRDLELWAIPRDGKPRSLGLLARGGSATLPLPAELAPVEAPVLAVSLEPRGGAPAGSGPTGPVLFKGQWIGVQG